MSFSTAETIGCTGNQVKVSVNEEMDFGVFLEADRQTVVLKKEDKLNITSVLMEEN